MPKAVDWLDRVTETSFPIGPITVDQNILINRGIEVVRPKRLNLSKAATTLVRQVARRSQERISKVNLVASDSDSSVIHDLLPDFDGVTITTHSVRSFLSQLKSHQEQSVVWGVCGKSKVFNRDPHREFAQALLTYQKKLQKDFLDELMETQNALLKKKKDFFSRKMENLCVEDKLGNHGILDIWEPSVKSLQKDWRSRLQKKQVETKMDLIPATPGFGFGAIVTGMEENPRITKKINCTTSKLRLERDAFDLNSAFDIQDLLDAWLKKETNIGLSGQKSVYMSIPSGVVAAHFRETWLKDPSRSPKREDYKFHDLIWGWHPLITLQEFLARANGPAVLIHTGDFPSLDFVAMWES